MSKVMKFVAFIFIGAALLLPACQKKDQPAAPETYKIGAIFAVTGPASFLGTPEKNTAEMIAEQINAAGGINGKMLEVIVIDSQTDATKAVMAANKLIKSENVLAIIGPSTSGESLAVVEVAERNQVPLVSCAASRKITEPIKPWIFKTAHNDKLTALRVFDHIKQAGATKVALITASNAYGQSGREELLERAGDYGLEIVADEVFAPKDTDMTVQLTKIRAAGAEVIVCWGTNPGPAIIARNMVQLGLTQQLYNSQGVASKKFIELAGDAANGIILTSSRLIVAEQLPDTDPQKKLLLQYKSDYEKKFNEPASSFGSHAYDATMLVVEAIREVGGDRARIRDYIENKTGFTATGGVFSYSAQDHAGLDKSSLVLVEIANNDWSLMLDSLISSVTVPQPEAAAAPAEEASPSPSEAEAQ